MGISASANLFLCLEANARTNPSGVFVETFDQKVLNSEAVVHVRKLAFELRHLGVRQGDLIAIALPDSLSVLFSLAIFHEACTSTVLPREFVPNVAYPVDWMFTVGSEISPFAARTLRVDAQFLEQVEQNPYGITPREYESDDSVVRIAFSSGTTGQPNAVASPFGKFAAYAVNALETWMEGDPFLMLFGVSTPAGYNAFCLSVLDGRPFLSVGTAAPAQIVDLAARNRVTSLKGSPAQLEPFVEELERSARILPHIRSAYITGTVMPPALSARLRQVTDGCDIYTLYGSTEATIATARYYDSDDPFDAGQVFGSSEIEIVGDDDRRLPDGEIGRLRHRHPLMSLSYLGNPEATARNFKDGWFYSGDLGMIRPDGGLTLAGRSSEILNAGGVKIDPVQVDLFARNTPMVRDAASFTYKNDSGIHKIGLALVADEALDIAALVRNLRKRFGPSVPYVIARVNEIPRNSLGKPLRQTLATQFEGTEST